jgi:hypothetical protein
MATGYKTGGRAKGTPNKLTRDLREMILGALADAGGRAVCRSSRGRRYVSGFLF